MVRCSFLARFHELDGFFFIIEVWILPSFDGYEVVTGFALILLSLSGFYWVLLGFTGFYWVTIGFQWVSLGYTRFSVGFTGFN